jgi:hypothetical protein
MIAASGLVRLAGLARRQVAEAKVARRQAVAAVAAMVVVVVVHIQVVAPAVAPAARLTCTLAW